ncbi:hypothetical protein Bbelb_098770 [Branchiostoma belcheri]|nr:hypothetical protein Bbelb_098770 [Branchiostoma belcheri]
MARWVTPQIRRASLQIRDAILCTGEPSWARERCRGQQQVLGQQQEQTGNSNKGRSGNSSKCWGSSRGRLGAATRADRGTAASVGAAAGADWEQQQGQIGEQQQVLGQQQGQTGSSNKGRSGNSSKCWGSNRSKLGTATRADRGTVASVGAAAGADWEQQQGQIGEHNGGRLGAATRADRGTAASVGAAAGANWLGTATRADWIATAKRGNETSADWGTATRLDIKASVSYSFPADSVPNDVAGYPHSVRNVPSRNPDTTARPYLTHNEPHELINSRKWPKKGKSLAQEMAAIEDQSAAVERDSNGGFMVSASREANSLLVSTRLTTLAIYIRKDLPGEFGRLKGLVEANSLQPGLRREISVGNEPKPTAAAVIRTEVVGLRGKVCLWLWQSTTPDANGSGYFREQSVFMPGILTLRGSFNEQMKRGGSVLPGKVFLVVTTSVVADEQKKSGKICLLVEKTVSLFQGNDLGVSRCSPLVPVIRAARAGNTSTPLKVQQLTGGRDGKGRAERLAIRTHISARTGLIDKPGRLAKSFAKSLDNTGRRRNSLASEEDEIAKRGALFAFLIPGKGSALPVPNSQKGEPSSQRGAFFLSLIPGVNQLRAGVFRTRPDVPRHRCLRICRMFLSGC